MTEINLVFEGKRDIDRLVSLLEIALDVLGQMRFCYKKDDTFEEIIKDEFLFQDLLSQIQEDENYYND